VSVIEGSFDNIIAGNHIGTNAAGSAALPNAGRGVYIEDSHDNVIGDRFSTSARNVISGNTGNGVQIYMGSGNLIGNNHIGTNASILAAIPNGFHGITLEDASGTEVLSNTISGNQFSGIFVTTGQANVILGNLIGTDGKGDAAIPNRQDGITVDSDDNVIGSTGVDGPNIISGNIRHGVVLASGEGNEVAGNVIGLDRFDGPLGNGGSGIAIDFANDTLVSENTIAHNGFVQKESTGGVLVAVGDANRITGNSIHSNAELGIDVFHQGDGAGGISPNDPGDTDTGGNNAQNFPVLDSAEGGSLTVEGSLNSLPFVSYRIEFFISSECDVSGNGEGEVYLGGAEIELDGDGFTTFTANSPASVEPGDFVTATATNLETNDTSEFSNCVEIEPAPATPTPVATDTPPPTPTAIPTATAAPTGTTATATPTATPTPTPAPSGKGKLTQGDVDCDGDVDSADALKVLRHVAALSVSQEPGCPQIGSAGLLFADADCDGDVDSVDALKVLRHVAALPVTQSEPCADIGSPL
jgi:parallel beta-helix repeat protein